MDKIINLRMTGKHHSKKTKEKLSKKNKGKFLGEKTKIWKGNNVKYWGLHHWVRRHLGRPSHCEICKKENVKKGKSVIVYANRDHQYKRDLKEYIPMCYSCHELYDIENNLIGINSQNHIFKIQE